MFVDDFGFLFIVETSLPSSKSSEDKGFGFEAPSLTDYSEGGIPVFCGRLVGMRGELFS
jgi:hypothetical protein